MDIELQSIKRYYRKEGNYMFKDFKQFAMRGNIIDLAVGVIVGGAFSKIVTSLVNDIVMPLVGMLIGKVDFSNLFLEFDKATFKTIADAKAEGVATINYGIFLNNVIDFLIIAFSIFIVVRQINRFTKKKEAKPAVTSKKCKYCYSEIHIDATRCPSCTSILVE